jgi:hypothetical protein
VTEIEFELLDRATRRPMSVPIEEVLLAGYTGRDQAGVMAHIRELETLGVAPPPRVPMVYVAPPELLSTGNRIDVRAPHTSGEVEFFLVPRQDGLLVGVGSDHTDRDAEAVDVAQSKRLCPKVLSRQVWRHADIADHWDQLEISAWVTCKGERTLYQHGTLGEFLSVDALLEEIRRAGHTNLAGRLIFGGTLAVAGGFVYSDRFECRLHDPVLDRRLTCDYTIG